MLEPEIETCNFFYFIFIQITFLKKKTKILFQIVATPIPIASQSEPVEQPTENRLSFEGLLFLHFSNTYIFKQNKNF